MPNSKGNRQIEMDEEIARNPINKDVLFLLWFLFLLFHRPLLTTIGGSLDSLWALMEFSR
jgi:hypothetical protein|tara:strand:- start:143 stop:322 length:180 start_codon:yes stop_codon:yes gene_type:complete